MNEVTRVCSDISMWMTNTSIPLHSVPTTPWTNFPPNLPISLSHSLLCGPHVRKENFIWVRWEWQCLPRPNYLGGHWRLRNTRLGSVKSKQKLHIYRQLLSWMLVTSYFMAFWFFDGPASSENQTGARALLNPDCVSNIILNFHCFVLF